ncbi:ammonium transporter 1-like isoform X3 [Apis mellifera]|uniref:Ammonium transporter 1-like isoform X3 n=1 Tax=Apis mellifera TaxID=7460 RepID=A0A7M7GZJ5_APIME|nr:ammonium transporter 1-like isoform X3 [Apis mellifera]|eukprot:XP_006564874.1 ammonium transporter 1-like isoform X3 [Apis mellifera]
MEIGNNETNITNSSITETYFVSAYNLNQEDSNWIITNSFIIFTMQTGFGMLESGCVSLKNEVNIMMKNVVDIVLGGLTYWAFGFAMSFGTDKLNNPFIGMGEFLIDPSLEDEFMGPKCAAFLFQLSFATTSTTIVSGAMAERCNFKAYCLFSFLNTIVYCVPAGWIWGDQGFLKKLGAVDIAGSGAVHLVGGSSALACAIMLGPRLGRYDNGIDPLPLGCPVNAIMGLFVLWWGWLAFNSGSTYGVSGQRWQYAARAAISTMLASMGGGLVGLGFSLNGPDRIDILSQINGILGSLVAITDNPYPLNTTNGRKGLLKGGGGYLLGIQCLTVVCLAFWSFIVSTILLWFINKIIPIRMSIHDELLGADLVEHRIRHSQIGISRAMSALRILEKHELANVHPVGINPGHDTYIKKYNRKNRFNYGKQFFLEKKLSKNSQLNTITNAILTDKNNPNFAWID